MLPARTSTRSVNPRVWSVQGILWLRGISARRPGPTAGGVLHSAKVCVSGE